MRFTAYGATSLFPYAAAAACTVWQCETFTVPLPTDFVSAPNACVQLKLCYTLQHCAEQLIQLGAGVQAFCPSEQRLLFVVQNLFHTAAWDPSASDLPRISRAGDWLTGAFLMAM